MKLLSKPENVDLISLMNSYHACIEKITHFVLHMFHNRPKRGKSTEDSWCVMLYIGKVEQKKSAPTKKILPLDQKFLFIEIKQANLVRHGWYNCPNYFFQSPDSISYGWIYLDRALQALWYQEPLLSSDQEIWDHLRAETNVLLNVLLMMLRVMNILLIW